MKITSTNVIPPNVPSARKSQPNFAGVNKEERELRQQKYDLERLANDRTNPISAPMKFLAVATGAIITAGAMKVTLNTSLEMISKALKSDAFMKIRTTGEKAFNAVKDSVIAGYKSFKATAAEHYNNSKLSSYVSKQKEKFAKTRLGKFTNEKVSPKFTTLKEAIKTLYAEVKDISKEKMPTKAKIKKMFIDATAILSGGGVAIKEASTINKKSNNYRDDEEY